jgi:hypothetical protein
MLFFVLEENFPKNPIFSGKKKKKKNCQERKKGKKGNMVPFIPHDFVEPLDPTFGSFILLEPVSHCVNRFVW